MSASKAVPQHQARGTPLLLLLPCHARQPQACNTGPEWVMLCLIYTLLTGFSCSSKLGLSWTSHGLLESQHAAGHGASQVWACLQLVGVQAAAGNLGRLLSQVVQLLFSCHPPGSCVLAGSRLAALQSLPLPVPQLAVQAAVGCLGHQGITFHLHRCPTSLITCEGLRVGVCCLVWDLFWVLELVGWDGEGCSDHFQQHTWRCEISRHSAHAEPGNPHHMHFMAG